MFFILSKVLAFLLIPSNVVLTLGLAGLVLLLTRWRRAGVRLVASSLFVLVVVGFSPLGSAMVAALEDRFPPWKDTGEPVDGIIVLGGVINLELTVERGSVAIGDPVERLTEAAAVARRHPNARIVFSGGNPSLFPGGPPESDFVVPLFALLGVPAGRLAVDSRSRNTAENAKFSKALAKPKPGERWLLITSAMHMPRAVGCFRKAAFAVEPDPVDWRSGRTVALWRVPQRLLNGWAAVDAAAHEWIGLLAYWITGRTSELFPAPR